MKVIIEKKDGNVSVLLKKDGNTVIWENLSREEQLDFLNTIASSYNLFKRFVKTELTKTEE